MTKAFVKHIKYLKAATSNCSAQIYKKNISIELCGFVSIEILWKDLNPLETHPKDDRGKLKDLVDIRGGRVGWQAH